MERMLYFISPPQDLPLVGNIKVPVKQYHHIYQPTEKYEFRKYRSDAKYSRGVLLTSNQKPCIAETLTTPEVCLSPSTSIASVLRIALSLMHGVHSTLAFAVLAVTRYSFHAQAPV